MTSAREDTLLLSSHGHSQLNGDVPTSPRNELEHSASMEKIAPIHDNIFFKTYGKQGKYPSLTSSKTGLNHEDRVKRDSYNEANDNEHIEYGPTSGYVHKLRGRFSGHTIASTSSAASPSQLSKRFSSLEDITSNNEPTKRNSSVAEEPLSARIQKPNVNSSNLTNYHRARSIESLNAQHGNSRPLAVPLRHIGTKQEKEKPLKSPRESHVIAPDVDLARDDIIIIENTPSIPAIPHNKQTDNESDNEVSQPHSYREEMLPEELPKPNTVLTVRSIFETAATVSAASSLAHFRRPSDLMTDKAQGSSGLENNVSNRTPISSPSPVLSPRILSNDVPPFKSPDGSVKPLQRSSVEYSSLEDNKKTFVTPNSLSTASAVSLPTSSYSRSSPQSTDSTPRDDKNSSSPLSSARSDSSLYQPVSSSEIKTPSTLERGSLFESRHSHSPRSTASVKPTIASSPPPPVKPIPLSAPASAATSYKSRTVVPVAPLKKRDESEDDGTPVLIYQKQKSPRRKPERQNFNNNRSQMNGKEPNDFNKDLIIPKDAKSVFENDSNNKFASQPSNDLLKGKHKSGIEKEEVNNDESKTPSIPQNTSTISVTKDKTVINLSRNNNNDQEMKTTKSVAPGVPPVRPPRTRNGESTKSRPAPVPPKPLQNDDKQKNIEKEKQRQGSMIYISSGSDSSETDSSTPPETPRVGKLVTPEPVLNKVIPPATPELELNKMRPSVTPEPELKKVTPVTSEAKQLRPSVTPEPKQLRPSVTPEPKQLRPSFTPEPEPKKLITRVAPEPEREKEERNEKPIKGIPSIIANRLKQNNSPRDISNAVIESRDSGRDSPDGISVTLRKTGASPSGKDDDDIKRDSISNDIEMQIQAMRKKTENSRSKGGSGATQIFDSSQLAQKRKERKEAAAKAAAVAASQGDVPPLDLSGLNDNRSIMINARRKEIKPCNINFIGENAPTSRNLLKKQRKVKINIKFRENMCHTFEYPSEDTALQAYLEQHPNEPEEADDVLFLDNGGGFGESSDDIDDEDEGDVTTPRGRKEEDEGLKSNPALNSNSTLQSYRGRFQEDFVFGSHRHEPEPVVTKQEPEQIEDPDSMMLRPAEEETVDTWSTNDSSDLLF